MNWVKHYHITGWIIIIIGLIGSFLSSIFSLEWIFSIIFILLGFIHWNLSDIFELENRIDKLEEKIYDHN